MLNSTSTALVRVRDLHGPACLYAALTLARVRMEGALVGYLFWLADEFMGGAR